MKVKRGGMARRNVGGPNKNKSTTDEYTSEFPALDDTKKSEPNTSTLPSSESPGVVEVSDQNHEQQPKTPSIQNEDKKSVTNVETSQARHHTPTSRVTPKYNTTSPTNRNNRQDQQNGGPSPSSTNNKNYFNRSSTESPISKEKGAQLNRDSPSVTANSNFFNRRPQQNSGGHNQHNYKQQHYNSSQGGPGHNQQHQNSSPSAPRGRNFHQHHTSQQFNRDRYYSKGSTPSSSSNQHNYDQQHHSGAPTAAGTGRTQHGGGHYQHYNNRQCKYSIIKYVIIFNSSRYSLITIYITH